MKKTFILIVCKETNYCSKERKLKMKKTFLISLLLGILTGYSFSVCAYSLWYKNGFSPVPTTVYVYKSANDATRKSVHNACVAWNSAGAGNLVYRSTQSHSTTKFPVQNKKNEITKGKRGANTYVARSLKVRYSDIFSELYEVDIDMNASHPWSNYGKSGAMDIQSAITHELGHLLGLSDVTGKDNVSATMYYKMSTGETKKRTLYKDDKNGVKYIYD